MRSAQNPKRIIFYIFKEMPIVVLTLIFGIGYNAMLVFVPSFQGSLLDTIIDGKPLNTILVAALIYMAIVLVVQASRYFKRFFVRKFANKTKRTMRLSMYKSTINQDLNSLDKIEVGDLMTRCIGDVDITVEGIRKSITEILDTGIATISYVVMLMVYEPKATLISCGFIFASMLMALLLRGVVYKFTKAYRESASELTGKTYELTSNSILFRNYGVMEKQISSFETYAQDIKVKSARASLIENSLPPIYNVVASIGVVFVIFFGGQKVLDGFWTIGVFSAYLTLFLAFTVRASKISKLFNSVQKAKISWNRTKNYFERIPDKLAVEINLEKVELVVENLAFAYDKSPVFNPISFSACQAQIIGVTGKIASGKTSALLALTSLYGYNGSIRLNGRELNEFSREELSQIVSYSGHNSFLLDDTIRENIEIGRNVDALALLQDVCFDKDLENMPERENTIVGSNGVRLSGGQQSRISLARALAGQNKVVILDDPFSAVDQSTEKVIVENLKRNHPDKIFVITSHRPTILEYADKIVVVTPARVRKKGGQNA